MVKKMFWGRSVRALAASASVLGLMLVSVGAAQAMATQESAAEAHQEAEAAIAKAKQSEAERRAYVEDKLHAAKEALHEAHGQDSEARQRAVQELRERVARSPRIAFRGGNVMYGGGMAERVLRMADDLELTDQQTEAIKDARREQRRAEIERDAQIAVVELDLSELLEDRHTADLAAVEQLMQRKASLRVQASIADMAVAQQVWRTLTPEQQEKVEAGRHNIFMMRGDGPSGLLHREGPSAGLFFNDFDLDFGELMPDLDFGLEFLHEGDGLFELRSGDEGPSIWTYEFKMDGEGKKKTEGEAATKEGSAIGVSGN
jgi:Spy/CpxP family protein refolding chaperone